ncbi:MAG: outer membrane beta-barrel protein [Stenotrophomonas sp.]
MVRNTLLFLALAAAAGPALAQSDDAASKWSGFYVGASVGNTDPRGGDDGTLLFDTNLDGSYGDTVRTGAGADAFSPGFCGGVATGRTPGEGCFDDRGGTTLGARMGYDWQMGNWVFGALAEYNSHDVRDGVSGFSTTPASYAMIRELDSTIALRARAGMAFGQSNDWLAYATAGAVRAKVTNRFETTNTANAFDLSDSGDANGVQFGLGVERKIAGNVSLGLEYLRTRIDDEDTRVMVSRGTAPATNPFLLVNANGTDMRRSDDRLDLDTLQLTLNYRF